ncbi:hypothetical protein RFI_24607, partial [Reticulomyxa filosa]
FCNFFSTIYKKVQGVLVFFNNTEKQVFKYCVCIFLTERYKIKKENLQCAFQRFSQFYWIVDGSEEDGLDWINGVFEIDFGLRMDDRLTYKEVNGTRVIYHYSGSAAGKEREPGRWILGTTETIGSDSGWAFRLSWSISPDDFNAGSFQNNAEPGFVWTIFTDEEWVEHEQLHFRCESVFGDHDPMHDFLFVTTLRIITFSCCGEYTYSFCKQERVANIL